LKENPQPRTKKGKDCWGNKYREILTISWLLKRIIIHFQKTQKGIFENKKFKTWLVVNEEK